MNPNDELRLKTDRKLSAGYILKSNYKYLKPELFNIIISMVFMVINVFLSIGVTLIYGEVIDILAPENAPKDYIFDYNLVLNYALIYLAATIISQTCRFVQSMILQHSGQRIVYNMRMEVFSHIENMSQNQFNEMPVGSLVTRVASYTANMSDLFTNTILNVLRNFLTIVVVYVFMFTISVELSLIMIIFIVIVFVSSLIFSRIAKKLFRQERAYLSDLNTFLNENLSGMKLIQIFNQEQRKLEEFERLNERYRKARTKVTFAFAIYRPFVTLLYILAVATVLGFGLWVGLGSGSIINFYALLSSFFNPIQNLADQVNNIQRAFTASERLINLLEVDPEVLDTLDAIDIEKFEGKIEFKNVWFAYNEGNWILKDVSFVINPGDTCAFVGATGAGKTTILSLLVRNYEIQKGQILIDGIDIKKIKMNCLRKGIGQMLQDVFLFSGSIKSNITLHDDSFTPEEIKETCDYVNASSFIDKLELGVETEVIERGENFSQGQRQLLSFARTVLHRPQILILDEATANIDTETEVLIQESLEKIKNIGTMLVVAHRLSTIQHADQIIVLQNGEIIERGNHQELLKNKGHYYKLYQLQFEEK